MKNQIAILALVLFAVGCDSKRSDTERDAGRAVNAPELTNRIEAPITNAPKTGIDSDAIPTNPPAIPTNPPATPIP